ncbi:hypothetical protein [Burkholderia sp. Ac-20344]|uniref:hypothetical protein n=1 Tax=Burkholderia sp. Ac-20344 TaxID=2703890 RepID=UPI00197B1218|nr:hypothetical protein [Burkholderia sp. Ac-20344]MBN3833036.1 hypothetical protein [Burkholderia sp. Ac-20344]
MNQEMTSFADFYAAGFYAFLAILGAQKIIEASKGVSIFFVGLPIFMVLFIFFLKRFPAQFMKSGFLSVSPKKIGPWFK